MDKRLFFLADIDESLIHYTDRYLKRVIINAKYHYYRRQNQKEKYRIVLFDLDSFSEELGYEDSGYESVLCQYIEVNGIRIPVLDPDLADALLSLTEVQRLVLLKNICLDITMKEIACELQISERMVRKYKHNAIEAIKRRMREDAQA